MWSGERNYWPLPGPSERSCSTGWTADSPGTEIARGRRGCVFVATLVALLIALASKESAFVVPGLFLLVDWFDARSEGGRWGDTVRRHGGLWIAALALTAWWLWLWVGIQGDLSGARGKVAPGLEGAGLVDRLVAMAPVSLHYVRLLLVPAQLSADYSPDFLPVADGVTPAGVVGALVVVLSLAVAYSVRDRAAPVSLGIAWTAGSLLIVSNVLVPTEILLAERTLYLASVGTVIAVAWLLVLGLRRKPVVTSAVFGVMLVLGLARTAMRVPIWNDNETLFPQLIEDAPGSYRALWIGAILAYEGGDPTRGETLLREALQVHPLDEALWRDFGAQLQREGRWIEAGRAFSVAFDLAPVGRMSATQSILAYLQGGVVDSADAVADRAAITPQDDWRLRIAAADVAAARGRWQEAMELRASVARDLPTEAALWLSAAEAADAVRSGAMRRASSWNEPRRRELWKTVFRSCRRPSRTQAATTSPSRPTGRPHRMRSFASIPWTPLVPSTS